MLLHKMSGKMFLLLCLLSVAQLLPAVEPPQGKESQKMGLIARLSSAILNSNHYRKTPRNAEFSRRVFREYAEQLDPAHCFLCLTDLQPFYPWRDTIFQQLNDGRCDWIYRLYQRYLDRLAEYRSYAEKMLQQGFDYTVDEEFQFDRRKVDFPANEAELHELWRKKLKNDLLYMRLLNTVAKDEAKEAKKTEAPQGRKEAQAEAAEQRWLQKTPEERIRIRLHDLYNQAAQVEPMDVLGIFLTSLAQSYGPHSHYSTPREEEDFNITFKLELSGIGATLTNEDGFVKIVDLVPGGPAAKSGKIQVEDRIIAVAQEGKEPEDVIDMSVNNVVKLVRGKAGTKVTLTLLSPDSSVPHSVTLTRAKIKLEESAAKGEVREAAGPDGKVRKIGVISFNTFYMDFEGAAKNLPNYRSTSRDVRKLLEDFQTRQVDAVVLDFRANSGGSFPEAIAVGGLFIESGPIVQTVDAQGNSEVYPDPDPGIVYRGPLVVLTSKISASAAEIVAGMIKDYHRGLLVGDSRTYGKGTVLGVMELQKVLGLANRKAKAGSITFETAMFYRVNGDSNQLKGVPVDVTLPSFTESMEFGEEYNRNALPWSTIASVEYPAWPDQKAVIAKVRAGSEARRALDPEWRKHQFQTERFRKIREGKTASLNEAKRLQEYYTEKQANDQTDRLLNVDGAGARRQDPVLQETLSIAAEYAQLLSETVPARP